MNKFHTKTKTCAQAIWAKYSKGAFYLYMMVSLVLFAWGGHRCYRMFYPYCPDEIALSIEVQHNAKGTTKTLLISLHVPEGQELASTEPPNIGLGYLKVSCFADDEFKISFEAPIFAREQSNPHELVYKMHLLESSAGASTSELLKHRITKVELKGKLPFIFTDAASGISQKKGAFELVNCIYSSPALSD